MPESGTSVAAMLLFVACLRMRYGCGRYSRGEGRAMHVMKGQANLGKGRGELVAVERRPAFRNHHCPAIQKRKRECVVIKKEGSHAEGGLNGLPWKRRFLAAAFKNASSSGLWPYTSTHSSLWMCSCACSHTGPTRLSSSSANSMMAAITAYAMDGSAP